MSSINPLNSNTSNSNNQNTPKSRLEKSLFTRVTGFTVGLTGYILSIPLIAVGVLASTIGAAVGGLKAIKKSGLIDNPDFKSEIIDSAKKTAIVTFEIFFKPSAFFIHMMDDSTSHRLLGIKHTDTNHENFNLSLPNKTETIEEIHQIGSNIVNFSGEKLRRAISPIILNYENLHPIAKISEERLASLQIISGEKRNQLLNEWKMTILAQKYLDKYTSVEVFLSSQEIENLSLVKKFATSVDLLSPKEQNKIKTILSQINNQLEPFLEVVLNEIERGNQGDDMLHAKYLGMEGLNISKKDLAHVTNNMILSLNNAVESSKEFDDFSIYLSENLANAYGTVEKRDQNLRLDLNKHDPSASYIKQIIFSIVEKNSVASSNTEANKSKTENNLNKMVDGIYDLLNGEEVKILKYEKINLQENEIIRIKNEIFQRFQLHKVKNANSIDTFLSHSLNAMTGNDFQSSLQGILQSTQINEQFLEQDQVDYLKENLLNFLDPQKTNKEKINPYSGTKLQFPDEINTASKRSEYILQLSKNMLNRLPNSLSIKHDKSFVKLTKQLFEYMHGVTSIDHKITVALEMLQNNSSTKISPENELVFKEYLTQVANAISAEKIGLRPQIPHFEPSIQNLWLHSTSLSNKQINQLAKTLLTALELPNTAVNKQFVRECIKEMQGTGLTHTVEASLNTFLQECDMTTQQVSAEDQKKLQHTLRALLNPMKTDRPLYFHQLTSVIQSGKYQSLVTEAGKEKYISKIADRFTNELIKNKVLSNRDKYFAMNYMKPALFQLHGFSASDQDAAMIEKRKNMGNYILTQLQSICAESIPTDSAEQIEFVAAKIVDYQERKGGLRASGFKGEPLQLTEKPKSKSWISWATSAVSDLLFNAEEEVNPIESIETVLSTIHAHFEQSDAYLGSSPSEIKKIKKQIDKTVYELFGLDTRFKLSKPDYTNEVVTNWSHLLLDSNPTDSVTEKRVEQFLTKLTKELQFSSLTGKILCPKWPYPALDSFGGMSLVELQEARNLGLDVDQMVLNLSTRMMSQVGEHFPEYEKCRMVVAQAICQMYGLPSKNPMGFAAPLTTAISEDLEKYLTSVIHEQTNKIVSAVNENNVQALSSKQQTFIANFLESHALPTLTDRIMKNQTNPSTVNFDERPNINLEQRYEKSVEIVDRLLGQFLPNGPANITVPEMELTQQAIAELASSLGVDVLRRLPGSLLDTLKPIFENIALSGRQVEPKLLDVITEISPTIASRATTSITTKISNKVFTDLPEAVEEKTLSFLDKKIDAKLDQIKYTKGIDLHQAFHAAIDALSSEDEERMSKAYQALIYHTIRSNMINKLYEVSNKLDDPVLKMQWISKMGTKISQKVTTPKTPKEKKTKNKYNIKTSTDTSRSKAYGDFGENLVSALLPKITEHKASTLITKTSAKLVGRLAQKKVNKSITKKVLEDVFNTSMTKVLSKVASKTGQMKTAKTEGSDLSLTESNKKEKFDQYKAEYQAAKENLKEYINQKAPIANRPAARVVNNLFFGLESTLNGLISGDLVLNMMDELAHFATNDPENN